MCYIHKTKTHFFVSFCCHPPSRGVWIEIDPVNASTPNVEVTPPRGGCGLKYLQKMLFGEAARSPPLAGGVD